MLYTVNVAGITDADIRMARRCVHCGALIRKPIGHSLCPDCYVARLKKIVSALVTLNNEGKGNTLK